MCLKSLFQQINKGRMMLTRELEEGEKQALKGANYTKNLFYLMTCIATFNCIIRSDYNFAFGLMGYYMIKTVNIKKIERTAYTVSTLSVNLYLLNKHTLNYIKTLI